MNKITFVYKGRYFVRDTETISYLSAIAKSCGYTTSLAYDQDLFGISDNILYQPLLNRVFNSRNYVIKRIVMDKPKYVVFLKNFNNSDWIKNLCQILRRIESNIKIVVISPINDGVCFTECDYYFVGEPEQVFRGFLTGKELKGVANMDTLPLPDKDLFAEYIDFSLSYMVYTSKGCVGSCSYCEETIYKNEYGVEYYRRRKVENVIAELKLAKEKYSCREVIFKDSVFTVDKNWLKKFLEIYRREINIPYKCFGKADVFDEEIAQLLKSSGCYCVEFGIQTLNEKIRYKILCRKETLAQIKKALEICEKYQLRYDIDHMFGLPEETVEDHKKALEFYSSLKYLNRIKCHNLVVYPQAKIREFIASTDVKDFFAGVAGEGKMKQVNKNFEKIFKVLPLLPGGIVSFLLKRNNWRLFSFVPTALIILAQLIIGIKNRDLRFKVYIYEYPRKILYHLKIKFFPNSIIPQNI